MKRCPTCNKTFDEDWLAFCTQDGTTLIEESPSRPDEPPPTIMASAPPPPAGGWQQPSGGLGSGQFPSQPLPPPPANVGQPSGGLGSGQFQQPQPLQGGWQPPPPPAYAQGPKQGLAIASLCCGIFTITFGWCCYLGVLSGLPAIGLGVFQLIQIKNNPEQNGGKPLAIAGIATAAAYYVLLILFILLYGMAIFMGGMNS